MTAHRYHRQVLLPGIGDDGQRRITAAHALVVGCGALGAHLIDTLARAGVGTLTLVDRDVVELTNLQRQTLYTEQDAREGTPKALAAAARVQAINSSIAVRPHVDDFNHRNAAALAAGADVIVDGLDNFETRYLLNDLAVRSGRPYVYGGAVATTGMALTILPHPRHATGHESRVTWTDAQATPCLRCVFPEPPPPGASPTCDTAGVLGSVISTVAAHQATQVIKLLVGAIDAVDTRLMNVDLWANTQRSFDVSGARTSTCRCCGEGTFEYIDGRAGSDAVSLCGRHAVQVLPASTDAIDLDVAATRLASHGEFSHNEHLLRGTFAHEQDDAAIELTLFANGRAIVKGTTRPEFARSIYARYVGT